MKHPMSQISPPNSGAPSRSNGWRILPTAFIKILAITLCVWPCFASGAAANPALLRYCAGTHLNSQAHPLTVRVKGKLAPKVAKRIHLGLSKFASTALSSGGKAVREIGKSARLAKASRNNLADSTQRKITLTLERISKGEKHPHRNDGSIFYNREGKLPQKADREYYREYVAAETNDPPGKDRVVIGKAGETYYTSDHYETFTRVPK